MWMVVVWVICIGVGSVVLITKVEAKQGEMPKTKQGTKIPYRHDNNNEPLTMLAERLFSNDHNKRCRQEIFSQQEAKRVKLSCSKNFYLFLGCQEIRAVEENRLVKQLAPWRNGAYSFWNGEAVNEVCGHKSGVKKLYVFPIAAKVAFTKLPKQRVHPRDEV